MSMTIQSSAFENNQPIPQKYTGDGADVSPPLSWSGAPSGTKEFALICDDPDAPRAEPFVHWVIYQIPASTTSLTEDVPANEELPAPSGALQGRNDFRTIGYRGPAPPPGSPHHYHFKIYALDAPLDVKPGLTKDELLEAMEGHVLAQGEIVGTYER